jgi:hypothetical protein
MQNLEHQTGKLTRRSRPKLSGSIQHFHHPQLDVSSFVPRNTIQLSLVQSAREFATFSCGHSRITFSSLAMPLSQSAVLLELLPVISIFSIFINHATRELMKPPRIVNAIYNESYRCT